MVIIPLPPSAAISRWDNISLILSAAMAFEDGKYTLDDVREMVADGAAHTWIVADGDKIEGVAITQVVRYPQKSMLLVLCLAGKDFHLWDNIVNDFFIPYARHVDCQGIEFLGRKGWARRALKLGFKPVQHLYSMTFTDDNTSDESRRS